ncbi:MAG: FmdB family transcriptional regulator [Phycisphaeraceae bacterium]|nr:FmdB family transcriptional regulator [Phycisphaeraceae bacterium]
MPTYLYQVILDGDDADEGQVFEVVQKMSDSPLTHHPKTGQPVRRIITAPNIATRYTSSHEKKSLSNENLAAKGFTKYERAGDGQYVKTAGKGPDHISRD